MDPIIGGAIIKGVGGLLGGLLGKKNKAPTPGQNIMSHMQGIRDGAEKYGFNPLAWAGTGAVTAPEPTNYMGAAIADAIGGVADAWSNKAFNHAQLDQLEMENEKMRRELNAATIRPDVPGLYGRGGIGGGAVGVMPTVGGWMSDFDNPDAGPESKPRDADGLYESRLNEKTVVTLGNGVTTTPSSMSDAEAVEKRYGDVASWMYGVAVAAADAGATARTWTDKLGWTVPGKWAGEETAEKLRDMIPKTKPPDGYTETGKPFWINPDGSVKWRNMGTE